jgi:hypothetical protein
MLQGKTIELERKANAHIARAHTALRYVTEDCSEDSWVEHIERCWRIDATSHHDLRAEIGIELYGVTDLGPAPRRRSSPSRCPRTRWRS